MSRPARRKPTRQGMDLALHLAIEARVEACIPMQRKRAEAELLALLRDEFGEALEVRGEATVRRACDLVRAWRMR